MAGLFKLKHMLCSQCLLRQYKASTSAGVFPLLRKISSSYPKSYVSMDKVREELEGKFLGAQNRFIEGNFTQSIREQDELPTRKMKDSYHEIILPLGSDETMQRRYINFYKGLRFGRLLEDTDGFAVLVAISHILAKDDNGDNHPSSLVTASVDRMEMVGELRGDADLKLAGHVTWVGRSSMEVTMDIEQQVNDVWQRFLTAQFVIVAIDAFTQIPTPVNALELETEEDRLLNEQGKKNHSLRLQRVEHSLLRTPPDEDERLLIHDMFISTVDPSAATFKVRVKPENSVWMEDALLKNLVVTHPEERNIYNKIFGGFLMRIAFELAWANASLYAKHRPFITTVDNIAFRKPVEIGSLLFLSSQIVYTKDTRMQIKVHAEMVDPRDGTRQTTNMFHFTFDTKEHIVPTVIPKTYAEAMMYLDGKRHFEKQSIKHAASTWT